MTERRTNASRIRALTAAIRYTMWSVFTVTDRDFARGAGGGEVGREEIAAELGGKLPPPHLSWKYSWIKTVFGWRVAKHTALEMRKIRWSLEESLDKLAFRVKGRELPLTSMESQLRPGRERNSDLP